MDWVASKVMISPDNPGPTLQASSSSSVRTLRMCPQQLRMPSWCSACLAPAMSFTRSAAGRITTPSRISRWAGERMLFGWSLWLKTVPHPRLPEAAKGGTVPSASISRPRRATWSHTSYPAGTKPTQKSLLVASTVTAATAPSRVCKCTSQQTIERRGTPNIRPSQSPSGWSPSLSTTTSAATSTARGWRRRTLRCRAWPAWACLRWRWLSCSRCRRFRPPPRWTTWCAASCESSRQQQSTQTGELVSSSSSSSRGQWCRHLACLPILPHAVWRQGKSWRATPRQRQWKFKSLLKSRELDQVEVEMPTWKT